MHYCCPIGGHQLYTMWPSVTSFVAVIFCGRHGTEQWIVVITFEQTVARLKYSLELVKTLFGSMASASEYRLYASSVLLALKAALPSSFFCIRSFALYSHQHKQCNKIINKLWC